MAAKHGKHHVWYKRACWLKRRAYQLRLEPLCAFCLQDGKAVLATVADHVTPHRGDLNAFVLGKLQSLCAPCHDRRKARVERIGYLPNVDANGWPTDPRHPVNVRLRELKAQSKSKIVADLPAANK